MEWYTREVGLRQQRIEVPQEIAWINRRPNTARKHVAGILPALSHPQAFLHLPRMVLPKRRDDRSRQWQRTPTSLRFRHPRDKLAAYQTEGCLDAQRALLQINRTPFKPQQLTPVLAPYLIRVIS